MPTEMPMIMDTAHMSPSITIIISSASFENVVVRAPATISTKWRRWQRSAGG
jgi:hypothetical protein